MQKVAGSRERQAPSMSVSTAEGGRHAAAPRQGGFRRGQTPAIWHPRTCQMAGRASAVRMRFGPDGVDRAIAAAVQLVLQCGFFSRSRRSSGSPRGVAPCRRLRRICRPLQSSHPCSRRTRSQSNRRRRRRRRPRHLCNERRNRWHRAGRRWSSSTSVFASIVTKPPWSTR